MTEIAQPYWSVSRTYGWGREWLFSGNRGWKRTALSSLYQLETRKIPVREEAIWPSEEGTANGGPAWGKTAPFFPVDEQTTGRTRNFSAWVFSNSWREEEKSAWVKSAFFLSIQKSTMGGVCVEAWTDSPATPHPEQLTAITSLSFQQKLLIAVVGWDKRKRTHRYFPSLAKVDKFPHPYPCENHAPIRFSCRNRSWLCSF